MKLLLYCTKAKPYLLNQNVYEFYDSKYITSNLKCHKKQDYILNGKIVAECDFEVEKHKETTIDWLCMSLREKIIFGNMCEKAKIDELECYEYANGKSLYAIHIKNLHIFDEPNELSDYHISYFDKDLGMMREHHIEKAPQNMCKVFNTKNNYILISIRPEWLVKILNGEKTIEIRKSSPLSN